MDKDLEKRKEFLLRKNHGKLELSEFLNHAKRIGINDIDFLDQVHRIL